MDDVCIDLVYLKKVKEYYNCVFVSCFWKFWVKYGDGGICYGNLGVEYCLLVVWN